jgi:hypothetical protein
MTRRVRPELPLQPIVCRLPSRVGVLWLGTVLDICSDRSQVKNNSIISRFRDGVELRQTDTLARLRPLGRAGDDPGSLFPCLCLAVAMAGVRGGR